MQYLYLIKCQTYYKIGVANDVESRLAQLSTGNPFPLEVHVVYEFDNAEPVEKAIHQKYKEQRHRGEWFTLSYDDTKNIHSICLMLGGRAFEYTGEPATEEVIEEAETVGEYMPTIEDVKRIMNDPSYRLEYRYGDKGLRGFTWRLRTVGKESALYIGRKNPDFEAIKAMLPEHRNGNQ